MSARNESPSHPLRDDTIVQGRPRGRSPMVFLSVVSISTLLLFGIILAVIQTYLASQH